MGLKAKLEAIIYAAEEPITLEQISLLVKDIVLAEEAAAKARLDDSPPEVFCGVPFQSETDDPGEIEFDTENIVSDESPEAAPYETHASVEAPEPTSKKKRKADAVKKELSEDARVRAYLRPILEELMAQYQAEDRGIEIRQIAGGYKMATKPEHHDVVRAFAKSLKPPVRLSLAALETLAVIAYKQPVTVPEISEIRGVESGGVIGTLLDRKLISTAGRKQVIGRPILYKTSKDFLTRFGLNDVSELPSMEEFEKIASDGQGDLFTAQATPTEPPAIAEASESTPEQSTQQPSSEPAENPDHEHSTADNS
jgi:segregation and condensation protein B